ncbi:MAG: HAMP domain-containing sensor histidine kinase [Cyanobacteria bacterium P01_F01_bin.150]
MSTLTPLHPYTSLLKAKLSRRIVLWVFASIIVIEGIILIPSVYRREKELLETLQDISAAQASGILETKPEDASDEDVLDYVSTAETNDVVLGGRFYVDGKEIGSFGEVPELTLADILQRNQKSLYNRNLARYDALWQMKSMPSWPTTYTLIIRHDARTVKQEFYAFIWRIVGLVIIISVFVTGATMIVLNRMVILPIMRLRDDLRWAGDVISHEALDPPPKFASLETRRQDELGEVMTAFGGMIHQIAEAIAERKKAEATVARLAEIGELSSMIVHEVRNPLTTVLMGLNSFKSMDLSERAKGRLNLALEESARLQRLLNEILMYAKDPKLDLGIVDVNALVEELTEPLREMPSATNRCINIENTTQPIWIQGDKDKLKQVFINLVSNACEAIAEGETVSWQIYADTSSYTQIQVHNEGKPIPPDVLPHLTKPFFTTKSSGNGLGLAITKRIIEAHNGTLVIESTEETGTTVTVSLPLTSKANF